MITGHFLVRRVNQDLDRGLCKALSVISVSRISIFGHLALGDELRQKQHTMIHYDLRRKARIAIT